METEISEKTNAPELSGNGPAILGKASREELWAKRNWWKKIRGIYDNDEALDEVMGDIEKRRKQELESMDSESVTS